MKNYKTYSGLLQTKVKDVYNVAHGTSSIPIEELHSCLSRYVQNCFENKGKYVCYEDCENMVSELFYMMLSGTFHITEKHMNVSIGAYINICIMKRNPFLLDYDSSNNVTINKVANIMNENIDKIDTVIFNTVYKEYITKVYSSLSYRECFIIYCLVYEGLTQEETGKMLSISKDRVRQIYQRALREFRKPTYWHYRVLLN